MAALATATTARDTAIGLATATDRDMAIGPDTVTGELLSAAMSEAVTMGAMQVAVFTGITAVDFTAAEAEVPTVVEAFMAVADVTAAGTASSKRFNSYRP